MPTQQPITGESERDPALVAFGELVRKRRGTETVFSLAVRSRVPPQTIYKVEKGEGGHLKTALKLARALGIKSIPVIEFESVNT